MPFNNADLFRPDELITAPVARFNSLRGQLDECLAMLDTMYEYMHEKGESERGLAGVALVIGQVCDKLEETSTSLHPENIKAFYDELAEKRASTQARCA